MPRRRLRRTRVPADGKTETKTAEVGNPYAKTRRGNGRHAAEISRRTTRRCRGGRWNRRARETLDRCHDRTDTRGTRYCAGKNAGASAAVARASADARRADSATVRDRDDRRRFRLRRRFRRAFRPRRRTVSTGGRARRAAPAFEGGEKRDDRFGFSFSRSVLRCRRERPVPRLCFDSSKWRAMRKKDERVSQTPTPIAGFRAHDRAPFAGANESLFV